VKIINPHTGDIVGEIAETSDRELQALCKQARAAFGDWRRTPLDERAARVRAGVAWFRENKAPVAREITLQMGKPIVEARREVDTMCDRAEYLLSIAAAALQPEVLPPKAGFTRRIEHAPLGVVLDLAAWNYPLLIAVNVVVPALLAGNVVLLKHSARTPLCGQHFASAFPHVFALQIDHAQAAQLIQSGQLDHVAFTGSVAGGRHVFKQVAAAPRFLDTGLELGGKDPAYVAADADLDFAVPNVVEGATYNAGQSCCAVERAYVHKKHYDAFLERAQAELAKLRLGDPLDEATTIGPMASRDAVAFLTGQVRDAVSRGARLLAGGKPAGPQDQFFEPTLLADCPNDSQVMQEETFGPILPVLRVTDDDHALQMMNDSRYGLTASVWTKDRARAEKFAAELQAGTVYQNRCDYLDPALPWTGVGDSGKGSTLSRYGFVHLTRRKAIHFRD
jgi:acyl-CoA reductase-like NAD-dependent aldehyde dehydrogenase